MIDKIKKWLSLERREEIQKYSATINDTIYATPRDYMKIILNEHSIRGQVTMCFLDERTLVLLVKTQHYLSYDRAQALKEKLLARIQRMGGCRTPKEIFWASETREYQPAGSAKA